MTFRGAARAERSAGPSGRLRASLRAASALLCAIAGFWLEPPAALAGAYIFAGEANGVDLVIHPTPYTGTGGTVNVSVCIDPTSANAAQMEIAVQNIVHVYNGAVPTTANLVSGVANNIPSNQYDFESVALHEVGHCIGMAHVNLASESGLMGSNQNYTKSTDGVDNAFGLGRGADLIRGSSDDLRGDDVNLHYFNRLTNDPFAISSVVDSTTYARDTSELPVGHTFATNADRTVAGLYALSATESVMQQGTFIDEAQRTLVADDVATLRYGMSGVDELEGTGDDYALVLNYAGLTTSCDVVLDFDNAQSSFAACYTSGVFISGNHGRITSAEIYFNTGFSWFFNDQLLACGNGTLEVGEECDDGNTQDGDCCSATCTFESVATNCDDLALCVMGQCDGAGTCIESPYSCDDGMFCNGDEICTLGVGCEAGPPVVIDDGVACTVDSCDEVQDEVVNTPVDANCDDSFYCTGVETCDPLLDCQAGTPVVVDDGVSCTLDSCDEAQDLVLNLPDDVQCSDGEFCNGAEICDPQADCQPGVPPDVDDGIACTYDICVSGGGGILHTPNSALCDDNDGETINTCDPGLGCVFIFEEPAPVPSGSVWSLGISAFLAGLLGARALARSRRSGG